MVSKKVVLHFPTDMIDKPIISNLVKDFNLTFNILKAFITPEEEGLMVLELSGDEKDFDSGIKYLGKSGVKIQPLSKDIKRNDSRCTNCGVCVTICPTKALVYDRETHKVHFYDTKCIACELCIKTCPVRAMNVHF